MKYTNRLEVELRNLVNCSPTKELIGGAVIVGNLARSYIEPVSHALNMRSLSFLINVTIFSAAIYLILKNSSHYQESMDEYVTNKNSAPTLPNPMRA